MTQQIHGTEHAKLKYSEEAFAEMYEALKDLMFQFAVAVEQPHSVDTRIYNQAEQALAKAEGREE